MEELYNSLKDPREWNNLAGDSKYEKILEGHRKWVLEVFADPDPTTVDFFFDPYQYTWLNKSTKQLLMVSNYLIKSII